MGNDTQSGVVVNTAWLDNFISIVETLAPLDPNKVQSAEIILGAEVVKVIRDLVVAMKTGVDSTTAAHGIVDALKRDFTFVTANTSAIKNLINKIFKRKVL